MRIIDVARDRFDPGVVKALRWNDIQQSDALDRMLPAIRTHLRFFFEELAGNTAAKESGTACDYYMHKDSFVVNAFSGHLNRIVASTCPLSRFRSCPSIGPVRKRMSRVSGLGVVPRL
jgi:hypothetical protein